MSAAVRTNYFRETMPQTVPSAGYNSPCCDYSAFTTDFDLSLLPASPESQVPLSPTNLSPYSYLCPSSPPMFSTNLEDGIICDSLGFVGVKSKIAGQVESGEENFENDDEPLHTPLKKSHGSGFFDDKSDYKGKDEKFDYYVKTEGKLSGESLIPTTVQATATNYYPLTIKQEPDYGTEYGNRTEFPVDADYGIKNEKSIDLREALEESKNFHSGSGLEYESKQYATLRSLLKAPNCENTGETTKADHQLLRSVLRDTSFQKKFNIKPFEFPKGNDFETDRKSVKMEGERAKTSDGNDMVEELTREKIEPVFSLAIEQIRKDVDTTCNILGIASDPTQWAEEDVKAWLLWTVRQFSLPMINPDCFKMDGATFCQLSEGDFQQRAPQSSSTLHAHLEIWKAASSCGECSTTPNQDLSTVQWSPTMNSSGSSTGGDLSEDEDEDMDSPSPSPSRSKPGTSQGATDGQQPGCKAKSGSTGAHIHLWQFLKELLASPQSHGSCIRWLDRQKGVFKIEDSVRVARLWGKRKNRPAMNYDKLSRSIRQYYKKGIMKKTERSQRLVYQFCHPYCL